MAVLCHDTLRQVLLFAFPIIVRIAVQKEDEGTIAQNLEGLGFGKYVEEVPVEKSTAGVHTLSISTLG